MKAAITIWENRISPVFDSAQMLLIVEIEGSKVVRKHYEPFNPEIPIRLTERLVELDAGVLICGAISELPAKAIESGGVRLIPFIAGNVDEILACYAAGKALAPGYLMPGCGRMRKQRKKRNQQQDRYHCLFDKEVNAMPRGDGTGPQGEGAGTGRGMGRCLTGKNKRGRGQARPAGQKQSGLGQGRRSGQNKGSRQGAGAGKANG